MDTVNISHNFRSCLVKPTSVCIMVWLQPSGPTHSPKYLGDSWIQRPWRQQEKMKFSFPPNLLFYQYLILMMDTLARTNAFCLAIVLERSAKYSACNVTNEVRCLKYILLPSGDTISKKLNPCLSLKSKKKSEDGFVNGFARGLFSYDYDLVVLVWGQCFHTASLTDLVSLFVSSWCFSVWLVIHLI